MFEMLLREATLLMAQFTDSMRRLNDGFELYLSDEEMHFVFMAVLAALLFFAVHALFRRLAKWSVAAISFIYVFTVMTVIGFAIEIGQKVSGTGEMEFSDIVAGLYGVVAFFAVYVVCRLAGAAVRAFMGRGKETK